MAGDKPFDPTPSRLARARREGDVPRSREVAATASFACAGCALGAAVGALAGAARRALGDAASGSVVSGPYLVIAGTAGAVVACALVGAVAATVFGGGGVTFRFPGLRLRALDPIAGFKRMAGRDALIGAARAFLTAGAVGAAVFPAARDVFAANAANAGVAALGGTVAGALGSAFAGAVAVAVVFAVFDALVERVKWRRRLRMSFDELKRDHKATEGNPLVRGRRRQAHRELVRGSIARVKDAAFVVANPQHVAIALEYAPPAVAVPRVLVRAIGEGALAVKERARTLGIPIAENVVLARALLAKTAVGDPIPRDEYGAVAAIVAQLLRVERIRARA
jgi:flagellar biosynthesis protein FlhB